MSTSTRKMTLSDRNLLALIFEVKKRPCLWNHEDESYNERTRIATAWEEIAAKIKLPEDLLRTKWKNLRDLFKREVKKCNANTVEEYSGKWRYFKTLWFLHRPGDNAAGSDEENLEVEVKDENVHRFGLPDTTDEVFIEEDNRTSKRLYPEVEIVQDPLNEKRARFFKDDYDTMFLMSLTPYFRELEPMRKLLVRNKIQELIFSEIAAQTGYNVLPH